MIKLIVIFILINSFLYSQGENLLGNIDLGKNIEMVEVTKSLFSDTLNKKYSYLFELEKNDSNYKYLYKNNLKIYFVTKDSIKYLFLFNGSNGEERNYFKSYDNPLSMYLTNIQDKLTINDLGKQFEQGYFTVENFETDSSYIINFNKFYDGIKSPAVIKYEFDKDFNKYLFITKVPILDGDTLDHLWIRTEYRPLKNNTVFSSLAEDYQNYLGVEQRKEMRRHYDYTEIIRPNDKLIYLDSISDIDDNKSNLQGIISNHKYMLLYNWGTWCGYCYMNHKNINKLYSEYNSIYPLISINCENDEVTNEELKYYINKHNIKYPVYLGCDFLNFNFMFDFPALLIVDSNFVVKDIISGYQNSYEDYEEFLRKNELIK